MKNIVILSKQNTPQKSIFKNFIMGANYNNIYNRYPHRKNTRKLYR